MDEDANPTAEDSTEIYLNLIRLSFSKPEKNINYPRNLKLYIYIYIYHNKNYSLSVKFKTIYNIKNKSIVEDQLSSDLKHVN